MTTLSPAATAVSAAPSAARVDPLDTTVRLVTPERISFEYYLAGPFRRSLAHAIDTLIWLAIMLVVFLFASVLSAVGMSSVMGLALVALFFMQWGYGAVLETFWNGQTIGKRVLGLRVLSTNGTPITGGQALLRHFSWAVEGALPLLYLPAIASTAVSPRFQRLGDHLAGTMVVIERRSAPRPVGRFEDPLLDALVRELPPRIAAGPQLARALADFVAKRARYSKPRREEMAEPLAAVLRERFGLPAETSGDLILCATYQRVFHGE